MQLNYNTENVELNEFQPVEKGWYNVQIIEESEHDTQKGGKQLTYKFRIYGDKFNGRFVFGNYNVICPGSSQAEEIARKEIQKLGKACHLTNIVSSSDLINCCCQILVDIEGFEGKVKNVIKAYDYAKDTVAPSKNPSAAPAKQWWEK